MKKGGKCLASAENQEPAIRLKPPVRVHIQETRTGGLNCNTSVHEKMLEFLILCQLFFPFGPDVFDSGNRFIRQRRRGVGFQDGDDLFTDPCRRVL